MGSSRRLNGKPSPGSVVPIYNSSSYQAFPPVTQFAGGGVTLIGRTLTANAAYVAPFIVPEGKTIGALLLSIQTAQAGKNFSAVLYKNGEDNLPGEILSYGTGTELSPAGIRADEFVTPIVSDGGIVWAGFWSDATTAQANAVDYSADVMPVSMGFTAATGVASNEYDFTNIIGAAYADGTAPDFAGGVAGIVSTDPVRMFLRADDS